MVWLRSFVGLWRSFLIQGQRKVFLLFLNRQMKTIDLIGVNRNDGNQHEQSQLDRVLLPVLLLFREASQKSKMRFDAACRDWERATTKRRHTHEHPSSSGGQHGHQLPRRTTHLWITRTWQTNGQLVQLHRADKLILWCWWYSYEFTNLNSPKCVLPACPCITRAYHVLHCHYSC